VTKQEVRKAINSLNRNKAADFYGITAENIVYGGDNHVVLGLGLRALQHRTLTASNIAMYVGLLRSLFSRSNSSTSNSQRSGDELPVNYYVNQNTFFSNSMLSLSNLCKLKSNCFTLSNSSENIAILCTLLSRK
jgi:hypothetical protein